MKQLIIATALLACATTALADSPHRNTINYQVATQGWVKAKSAKITVSVNASLNAKQLATFQQSVMQQLNTMAPSKKRKKGKKGWRVTNFNQTQSNSGLENVNLSASKRVRANMLASITNKVKALSKAGVSYKVSNIDFSPSFKQVEKTKQKLRQRVYQIVLKQLKTTNNIFKGPHYHVQSISFNSILLGGSPRPVPMASYALVNRLERKAAQPSLKVSQKINMTANVTLST